MNKTFKEKLYYRQQRAYFDLMLSLYRDYPREMSVVKRLGDYSLVFSALDKDIIKKICAVGVRAVVNCPRHILETQTKVVYDTYFISHLALKFLNVYDLVNLFPIHKDYNGERDGVKDYFYAVKSIEKYKDYEDFLDMDEEEFEILLSDLNSNILFAYLCKQYTLSNMYDKVIQSMCRDYFASHLKEKFATFKVIRKAGVRRGRN